MLHCLLCIAPKLVAPHLLHERARHIITPKDVWGVGPRVCLHKHELSMAVSCAVHALGRKQRRHIMLFKATHLVADAIHRLTPGTSLSG